MSTSSTGCAYVKDVTRNRGRGAKKCGGILPSFNGARARRGVLPRGRVKGKDRGRDSGAGAQFRERGAPRGAGGRAR